jgi:hypothetical protein
MSEASVRVLLLGESFGHSLHLLPRLEERGLPLLECHVLRGRRISIPGTQVSTDSERKLDKDGSARDFFPGQIRLQRLPCSTGGEKLLVAATHEKRSGRSWRSGPPAKSICTRAGSNIARNPRPPRHGLEANPGRRIWWLALP